LKLNIWTFHEIILFIYLSIYYKKNIFQTEILLAVTFNYGFNIWKINLIYILIIYLNFNADSLLNYKQILFLIFQKQSSLISVKKTTFFWWFIVWVNLNERPLLMVTMPFFILFCFSCVQIMRHLNKVFAVFIWKPNLI
jgi:hypothetical protein